MKKLLFLIITVMMLAAQAVAQAVAQETPKTNPSSPSTSSKEIKLEIAQYNNDTTGRHRIPMCVNLEAFYNEESNTIDIIYNGDADGEVFLYINEDIMNYSSEINTSLELPTTSGIYRIEIISQTWIAEGYIHL